MWPSHSVIAHLPKSIKHLSALHTRLALAYCRFAAVLNTKKLAERPSFALQAVDHLCIVVCTCVLQAPMVTFRKPIGSVSVSGHKFVGAPVPCGVVITRMRYVMALSSDVEYLNSRDATIMGSRNGHAPIYLWYTLTLKGYEGIRRDVEKCMRNAAILKVMLEAAGIKTMLNELSNTVVFERPKEEAFVRKWQLACEGDIAHVVVMPNITLDKLEEFVQDYVNSRARIAIANAKRIVNDARAAEAEACEGYDGDC